jgi:hypothetical protein
MVTLLPPVAGPALASALPRRRSLRGRPCQVTAVRSPAPAQLPRSPSPERPPAPRPPAPRLLTLPPARSTGAPESQLLPLAPTLWLRLRAATLQRLLQPLRPSRRASTREPAFAPPCRPAPAPAASRAALRWLAAAQRPHQSHPPAACAPSLGPPAPRALGPATHVRRRVPGPAPSCVEEEREREGGKGEPPRKGAAGGRG